MFHNVDLKSLSSLELDVYNYIISHPKQVQSLTIRELAQAAHVSTTTISRFCAKLNLSGFSELKYVIRDELHAEQRVYPSYDLNTPLTEFFTKVSRDEFDQKINDWLELVFDAQLVILLGIGTSGSLANYGARFLNNAGALAFALTDPFQPDAHHIHDLSDCLVVVLSVSGSTEQVLKQASEFKQHRAKIVAITNQEYSPLARLADLTVSYYMPERNVGDNINMTTQVPVVYLLETIANRYADKVYNE